MKRIIAAVAFAALAVPALAVEHGKPFEQTEVDRALPQVNTPAPADKRSTDSRSQRSQSPWANDWNFIAPSL
ncbi:MAG TPA: hypothetical protein VKE95_11185 [Burkholderiales bacterium]|nr:hypothetical protein [Burkholderiales bacterium]